MHKIVLENLCSVPRHSTGCQEYSRTGHSLPPGNETKRMGRLIRKQTEQLQTVISTLKKEGSQKIKGRTLSENGWETLFEVKTERDKKRPLQRWRPQNKKEDGVYHDPVVGGVWQGFGSR